MLTTIILPTSPTSPTATITTGLSQYWSTVITGLLILLFLMEILAATEKWNRYISCSFNIALIPLTFSFVGIIIFKIIEII